MTHEDYVAEFGQVLEAVILLFSGSVLLEIKKIVDEKVLTEAQAERLYENIGERLAQAMAMVDAKLERSAAQAE